MPRAGEKSIKSSTYKPDFRPGWKQKCIQNEALAMGYESAL
jgi:hypothetical protein